MKWHLPAIYFWCAGQSSKRQKSVNPQRFVSGIPHSHRKRINPKLSENNQRKFVDLLYLLFFFFSCRLMYQSLSLGSTSKLKRKKTKGRMVSLCLLYMLSVSLNEQTNTIHSRQQTSLCPDRARCCVAFL